MAPIEIKFIDPGLAEFHKDTEKKIHGCKKLSLLGSDYLVLEEYKDEALISVVNGIVLTATEKVGEARIEEKNGHQVTVQDQREITAAPMQLKIKKGQSAQVTSGTRLLADLKYT